MCDALSGRRARVYVLRGTMGLKDKVDVTANIAVTGVAILVSAVLIRSYFMPMPSAPRPARPAPVAVVGASLKDKIPGVDWKRNGRDLILGD